MNERPPLPQPDRDRPLHEVIEEFGERLRPGGQYGEIDEWSLYDESFRRLRAWAEENGCHHPHLSPLREGGTIEAMKMLTTVSAPVDGTIKDILVKKGVQVDSDDLLVVME